MLSPTPCIFWVPFYVKDRENSQKKQKCFYLPVAMWSLTSPMAAIQMPLLLGDTWWSSGRPLGGRLPAQSRLIANQLQWTFPNLPQRPPHIIHPADLLLWSLLWVGHGLGWGFITKFKPPVVSTWPTGRLVCVFSCQIMECALPWVVSLNLFPFPEIGTKGRSASPLHRLVANIKSKLQAYPLASTLHPHIYKSFFLKHPNGLM